MSFVPADRHRFGLVLSFPLTDNLVLTDYYAAPYARGIVRDERAIDARARRGHRAVRHPDAVARRHGRRRCPAATSRSAWSRASSIATCASLVLDQPTRGLDVGSVEFIHRQTIAKRDAGTAVLLVSAELDEVLELSDRIGVMYRGELVAVVDGRTADREDVGLLMATGGAGVGRAPDVSAASSAA